MMERGSAWFICRSGTGEGGAAEIRIEFQPAPDRFWPIEVLVRCPFPEADFREKKVLITGKGAMWMYAAASTAAVRGGAAGVWIQQADGSSVQVHPISASGRKFSKWFSWVDSLESDYGVVHFREPPRTGRWSPAVLSELPQALPTSLPSTVIVTGRGANWMYSGVAAYATIKGASCVAVFDPNQSANFAVRVHPPPGSETTVRFAFPCRTVFRSAGVVLGIVGDPNSGKSVLAQALDVVRSFRGLDGWLKDCDAASPTPSWYNEMVQKGLRREAEVLRAGQKCKWSHKMEAMVAEHLSNAKRTMSLLIADLPGGLFPTDGRAPQRIPPGREIIMKEVDFFLVLGKRDPKYGDTAREWTHTLAEHGFDDRIVAVWRSVHPDSSARGRLLLDRRPAVGVLRGLRRGWSSAIVEILLEAGADDWLAGLLSASAPGR